MKTSIFRNRIANITAIAAAVSMTLATPFTNNSDAAVFAKFDGIDGESQDADHEKWIDVLSIEWGAKAAGEESATGQSRRRGGVIVEDMRLTMEYEKASPKLQEQCLTGRIIPTLEIEQTANYGGSRAVYLKYELKNVLVTGFSIKGSGGELAESLQLNVSLNFDEISVSYTERDEGGAETGRTEFNHSLVDGEPG